MFYGFDEAEPFSVVIDINNNNTSDDLIITSNAEELGGNLAILDNNMNYITSDRQSCHFHVDSNNNLSW